MLETALHHPKLHQVKTYPNDRAGGGAFHTLTLTHRSAADDRAAIVLFIDPHWAEWDAIVDAVNAYRAKRADR
ncbi:hypothetical protein DS6A_79 [Mycobacterium phage DS6A]|uniref:Uncharacterized protein n=1 Tax=Mycobacterium phage DS6A TaxID=45764 RepID=G8I4I9_9CAUD|nr:hypothetical protein DS6A_79 [Mycobacterium phage DS6A]AER47633.1 hypothetical protein DS6A_79 [Mycobacterium phage DS6A]